MKQRLLYVLLPVLLLWGCNAEETETAQTVDWYKSHEAERIAMLKQCNNNPGELGNTPNCMNASAAARFRTPADFNKVEDVGF